MASQNLTRTPWRSQHIFSKFAIPLKQSRSFAWSKFHSTRLLRYDLSQGSSLRNPLKSSNATRRSHTTESVKTYAKQNPIPLRDACQCKKCVDESTHQRDFLFSDIPTNISVSSITSDPHSGTWYARWNNDIPNYDEDHLSVYPPEILAQLIDEQPAGLDVNRTISLWNRDSFTSESKEFNYTDLLNNDTTLSAALEQIQRLGLVFITAIPEDEQAVRHMVSRLALLRNTFYGETWDVRSLPQAKNVAYTAKYLGFHMDLLYMKEPPGLQLLHCLQNTCMGGESVFADTFKAIDMLQHESPEMARLLMQAKIRYGYSNDGHFYCDEKPVIQLDSRNLRPTAKILNAYDPGFIANVECVYWSPPFVNSIAPNTGEDSKGEIDTKAFVQASKAFSDILQQPEMIHETKLSPGTCTIFDNLRVVHARKAFDAASGSRWLKGIYGDRQDVMSKSLKHVWAK